MSASEAPLKIQVGLAVNSKKYVYIVRPSDEELLQYLEEGEYCNVLCSRQMGKTSLLHRTRGRLAEKGIQSALIDVAGSLGSPSGQSPPVQEADAWYVGLLQMVSGELGLAVDVRAWWNASTAATPNQRLIQFFREEVAVKASGRVVIFLDEIDGTLKLPFTDDFFVAIRSMYNDRVREPAYERLIFCLVGVATPNELIKEHRTTPYNVGRTIELRDYDPSRDDLGPLERAVSKDPQVGKAVVGTVLRWTAGHPYLTARLCDDFVRKGGRSPEDVERFVEEGYSSLRALERDIHFEPVLRFMQERVDDRLTTLRLYQRIWRDLREPDRVAPAQIALKLAGIVKRDEQGLLVVRNPIYRRVFTNQWARASLPAFDPRMAGVGLALAAALVLVVIALWKRGPSADLWHPAGPEVRVTEARSSYSAAAPYHGQQRLLGALPQPMLPLSELPKVGDDPLAVASFLLVRNDPGLVEEALDQLEQLQGANEKADSERAMAYLVRGDAEAADYEQALRYAEKSLQENPKHGPALWNKALALQRLGLRLLAAKTFDQVALLDEPGWASEARIRADLMRSEASHLREAWNGAKDAAQALVRGGSTLPKAALDAPISRRLFYDAVRTRTSSADVVALLPLAEQLDQRSGGASLQEYVRKIAGRDFKVRGPEAAKFRKVVVDREVALIPELSHSREPDIALGAMTFLEGKLSDDQLRDLVSHVKWVGDPWFEILLAMKQAEQVEPRDLQAAIKLLEDAHAKADALGLQYRSMQVGMQLITFQQRAADLAGAHATAVATWKSVELSHDWGMQLPVIRHQALLARLRRDYAAGKAFLGEAVERNREDHLPGQDVYTRQQLALLEVENLNMDAAREHLDAAIATGETLNVVGVGVLADVTRKRASSLDRQVIERFRAGLDQLPASERGLGLEAIGRWTLEVDPDQGRKQLQGLIKEIGSPQDPNGDQARARSFAFSALLMDAAKRGDFAGFVKLLEQEANASFPSSCAVALNLDVERGAVVVRGPTGALEGAYDGDRKVALPETLDGFVPERLQAGLRGCQEGVKVVARPPLFGRLGALPNSILWSYLLLGRSPAGPIQPGPHLVVQSPAQSKLAERLGLAVPQPFINSASPPAGISVVEGAEATPERIMSALEGAADADLIMQSAVDPYSGELFLLAAESPNSAGGRVTATQIRTLRLARHPTVMLPVCRATHAAPVLYDARSLPAAFLLAGARVVFAAAVDVPADEGPPFFEAVRARIREGTSPAVALRDVRQAWLSQGKVKSWVEGVLLFE